ncbi:hypothetical protein C0J52_28460 [Blattella germanica]|nr:hypothetical protein C0J52_28460 [Blattella germanica]
MASSNGDEIIGENKVKRRSGSRNEEQYKRNVIKKARLCGQSYTSHSGKLIPKVEIGPDCMNILDENNNNVNKLTCKVESEIGKT